ncbi:MAG: hypothetical protein DHS20C13_08670 [Thermodesulfobacteriota bacterium]|nr:MAG: hypothetical protein DHS20C13_08670 [Thermodesulfobacteriota bacterium]
MKWVLGKVFSIFTINHLLLMVIVAFISNPQLGWVWTIILVSSLISILYGISINITSIRNADSFIESLNQNPHYKYLQINANELLTQEELEILSKRKYFGRRWIFDTIKGGFNKEGRNYNFLDEPVLIFKMVCNRPPFPSNIKAFVSTVGTSIICLREVHTDNPLTKFLNYHELGHVMPTGSQMSNYRYYRYFNILLVVIGTAIFIEFSWYWIFLLFYLLERIFMVRRSVIAKIESSADIYAIYKLKLPDQLKSVIDSLTSVWEKDAETNLVKAIRLKTMNMALKLYETKGRKINQKDILLNLDLFSVVYTLPFIYLGLNLNPPVLWQYITLSILLLLGILATFSLNLFFYSAENKIASFMSNHQVVSADISEPDI